MLNLPHPSAQLCLFVCLLVLFFFINFLYASPRKIFYYAHFDADDLPDSLLTHFIVDNVTQGFCCINTCCWIELVSG